MTLLTVVQTVAKNIGVEPPTSLSSPDADVVLVMQFVNETGDEVERRVDWGALRQSTTVTGTGAAATFTLPTDYSRLIQGLSVVSGYNPVRGSLTASEWNSLIPAIGDPRYFYLAGTSIAFYPFARTGVQSTVTYQSLNWAKAGEASKRHLESAGDTSLVPELLLEAGAVWRWRRHVGKDFADYLAEFEAKLVDLSNNDGGVRAP